MLHKGVVQLLQMRQLRTTYQLRDNISSTLKNHGNTVLQKESSNSPESKLKVTEYCYLIDREFKILVIKSSRFTTPSESRNVFKSTNNPFDAKFIISAYGV